MGICICLLGFPLIVTKAAFTLDLTEFVDHGGGPHCLTFELETDKE